MSQFDLLIILRCHNFVDFVIDTVQSVEHNTSSQLSKIVLAVDGGNLLFSQKMVKLFGEDRVYQSKTRWGWGSGLFSLLVDSIQYFRARYEFNHVQSIDYDTLFIGPDVDTTVLNRIASTKAGLLGVHLRDNLHWKSIFLKERKEFEKVFGLVPSSYVHGEGCQGSCMVLTSALLHEMKFRKMFDPPYSVAKQYTKIADDHLLPIFARMCGLGIVNISDFACCHWNASDDPRGLEQKGIKIFHPTKLRAHNKNRSTEIEIRNYFRKLRGCTDLLR